MSWKRRLGLVVLVVIVMVGSFVFVLKSHFKHELQAQLAAIKAKGQPVTMAQLLGPKIPDSQNAAIIYERAISKLPKSSSVSRTQSKASVSDSDVISDFLWESNRVAHPELFDKVRQILQCRQEALALLDQAISMPKCRFSQPINLTGLVRLCVDRAILSARDGQTDQAVHWIDVAVQIGASGSDNPSTSGLSTGYLIYDMSKIAIRQVLNYGDLDYRQCEQLFQTLSKADPDTGYLKALEASRINMMGDWSIMSSWLNIDDISSGSDHTSSLADITEPSHPSPLQTLKDRILGFGYANIVWQGDEAVFLAHIGKQIDGAKLSYKDSNSQGLLDREPVFPKYAVVAKWLTLGPADNIHRFRFKSQISSDMVFLALLAYKSRFGSYPQKLDDIKARLGWTLPNDPYSGNGFFYKRDKNGFVVYSVGPNMKDDGGVQKIPHAQTEDETGDYVWKWDR